MELEACLVPAAGWPGIALHPGFGPLPSGNINEIQKQVGSDIFPELLTECNSNKVFNKPVFACFIYRNGRPPEGAVF